MPSTARGLIPVSGNLEKANVYAKNGEQAKTVVYLGLALSDVFLLKSIAVGLARGTAAAAGKLMVEEGAMTLGRGAGAGAGAEGAATFGSRVNTGVGEVRGLNCVFCTAGGSSTPQLTSSATASMAGMAEGPVAGDGLGRVFGSVGLGSGAPQSFANYAGARAFMSAQGAGARFGVGYLNPGASMGHFVAGRNTALGLVFRDFQASGLPWLAPQGAKAGASFLIYPF